MKRETWENKTKSLPKQSLVILYFDPDRQRDAVAIYCCREDCVYFQEIFSSTQD